MRLTSPPRWPGLVLAATLLAIAALVAGPAGADDRHEGYYYPEVTSRETYPARAPTLPDSDRRRRIGFVVGLTQQQFNNPFPAQVAIFSKGARQEKLIIVALNRDALASLYQARGFLAQMTASARASAIFVENRVEDTYTFLDLLALLGFEQLTISDGMTYAHQIRIDLQD